MGDSEGPNPYFNSAAKHIFPTPPKIIAVPELQECSLDECDTESPVNVLRRKYREWVEFPEELFRGTPYGGLTDLNPRPWLVKGMVAKWMNKVDALRERAQSVREDINRMEEMQVIVVAHGNFNMFLINQWQDESQREINWKYYERGEGRPVVIVPTGVEQAGGRLETMMKFELPPWYKGDEHEFQSWHEPTIDTPPTAPQDLPIQDST